MCVSVVIHQTNCTSCHRCVTHCVPLADTISPTSSAESLCVSVSVCCACTTSDVSASTEIVFIARCDIVLNISLDHSVGSVWTCEYNNNNDSHHDKNVREIRKCEIQSSIERRSEVKVACLFVYQQPLLLLLLLRHFGNSFFSLFRVCYHHRLRGVFFYFHFSCRCVNLRSSRQMIYISCENLQLKFHVCAACLSRQCFVSFLKSGWRRCHNEFYAVKQSV